VEEAAVKAIAEAYRFTAGTSTPYPPYWEVDRRWVPYAFLRDEF